LPPGLQALVEEYVAVELDDRWHPRKPDVRVVEEPVLYSREAATAVLPEASEELIIDLEAEPITERSVHIVDQTSGGRLVTLIEFLSPWNKESPEGRGAFHTKQSQLLEGGVNLVEVDLVRSGGWAMTVPEWAVPPPYRYPYRICVRRANDLTRAVCYKAPLQKCLPIIRVPLRPEDSDVRLDLQQLIEEAWERGGYYNLNHTRAPLPPFDDSDTQWVRDRLREYLERK
jgi:hypothetical protein